MSKYLPHILQICRKNGEYAERNLLLSTMPDKVNWTVFRENQMGDHKLTYDEQISNFIFCLSLTYKVLSAYVVNTLNNEKSLKNSPFFR
jgi:hypothetical protein